MTRSRGPAGRSGDPRKRALQPPPPDTGRRGQLVVASAMGVALVAAAFFALRPDGVGLDEEARSHAAAACDLTSKADEAAQVDTPARYAAAALLLDKAIIESARASEAAPEFADLDRAVQAVHLAAHRGDRGPWRDALDTALSTCRETFG